MKVTVPAPFLLFAPARRPATPSDAGLYAAAFLRPGAAGITDDCMVGLGRDAAIIAWRIGDSS